jgi:RNA-binding protein
MHGAFSCLPEFQEPAVPSKPLRPRSKSTPKRSRKSEPARAKIAVPVTVAVPAPQLTAARRKELRAAAHALQPIVQVGHAGLHSALIDAVTQALRDHELIKVRFYEPEDKQTMAELLASETQAALCGLVGHTVILYKPKPKKVAPRQPASSSSKRSRGAA